MDPRMGQYLVDMHFRAIQGYVPEAQATNSERRLSPPDPNDPYKLIVFPKLNADASDSPYQMATEYNPDWSTDTDEQYYNITRFSDEDLGFNLRISPAVGVVMHSASAEPYFENAIFDILVDTKGEFIATWWNYKDNDLVRRGSAPEFRYSFTMPLNELLFQAYQDVVGPEKTCNLKALFVLAISNTQFNQIVDRHYDQDRQLLHARSWSVDVEDDGNAFHELLGSELLAGKVHALINHHDATGNRRIEKVIVIPTSEDEDDWHAAVVLGERANEEA